jgi:hypothetical protein
MPACSRCLVEVFPGTAVCPSCGAAIRPAIRPKPLPKRRGRTRQRLGVLDKRELVLGVANVILLVSFWLPWYSIGSLHLHGVGVHGWLFIAVIDVVVLVLYVLITMFGVGDIQVPGRMSKDQLMALLTGVDLALVVLAFLIKPAGFSWAWGGFLALAAAVVAFLPFGVPVLREQRGH